VLGNQLLQALHDYRCEGYGSVVAEAVYGSFLGNGDDVRGFYICKDSNMYQEQVEQLGQDPCQLVRTFFDHHPWDTVRSSSFPGVHCSQMFPHLAFLEREGRSLVGVLER